MTFNNKKGDGRFMQVIIAVPIIILAGLFGTIGLFEIGEDFIIGDISNTSQETLQSLNVSNSFYGNKIQEYENDYDNTELPYDTFFAIILIGAFVGSSIMALQAQRLPTLNFLGIITVGIMFLLLIISFLDQFTSYFVNEFFLKLFDDLNGTTTILDWYFEYLSEISMVWFAVLLLLNQVRLDIKQVFTRRKQTSGGFEGRVEE